MRSATDILSISTGRETLLIGPRSAFGVSSQSILILDRHSLRHILGMFLSRPNAEELLRPHLRRWGIDVMSIRGPNRNALLDALANAASAGSLGIAVVPEVTLSFAGASLDDSLRKATPALKDANILPPDLVDRMVIVFSMVPDHMEGETRLAFEEAVKNLGIAVIAGGVCAWIGAHFIPGVNLAVLAFDLFFLSTEVLHALEKAAAIIEDVRTATSKEQLKPAAIALAAVLAVLIVNGVLNRLIKAKQLTKGVGKQGGSSGTSKPSLPKKEAPKKQQDSVRDNSHDNQPDGQAKKPKATKAQADKAKELGVDEKWVTPDGKIKWPPNEGFDGPVTEKVLKPGETISRYGGDSGTFSSPDGISFEARALPPSSQNNGERKFRVVKEMPVKSGKIAPWFDQPGGGTQYKSEKSFGDLLDEGIIEEIF